MSTTGANLVVESLIASGVSRLFSLSGNQILSIYDATIDRDIEIIHTRHEAAAVHMADAWGRLTEQPGVVLLTAGPGHCNAISALYVALMAESPVVLLSGHCPHAGIGTGAFQEIDQVAMAVPVTKASWLVEDASYLDNDIKKALTLARAGRPGPVYLSLPADVLETDASKHAIKPKPAEQIHMPGRTNDVVIEAILHRLSVASRPLILTGPAMSRPKRWSDVQRLSEITGIPALPTESPRGINDPWLHEATHCLSEADVVLLLGKKLDFSLKHGKPPFFNGPCTFLQVDVDEDAISNDFRVELQIHADPLQTAGQLADAAQKKRWPSRLWPKEVASARQRVPEEWKKIRGSPGRPIHPLGVCEALQPFLDAGGVLVSDGGEFGQWAQAGLDAQIRLINGPAGAIGGSIPMGIAAKLAHPERPVFVTVGDGAFGYHAMEFDTALRYNLPVIAIVGNDARWNAEHQLQLQHYGPERTVGCDLLPTHYDAMITALGGHGESVEYPDELAPVLDRAVASGLPACVNVVIEGAAAPMFR